MFRSQIGQDKYISDVIFKNKKSGFFIELGAADGERISNTFYFEKELGWKGVCIEPNPEYKDSLIKNRTCELCFDPVYSTSGKCVDFDVVNNGELSGMTEHIDSNIYNMGYTKQTIQLTTRTLTEILDSINAPTYIDYLSLDTEGTELEILKGLEII